MRRRVGHNLAVGWVMKHSSLAFRGVIGRFTIGQEEKDIRCFISNYTISLSQSFVLVLDKNSKFFHMLEWEFERIQDVGVEFNKLFIVFRLY